MKFEKLTINQNPFNNKGRVKKIYQGCKNEECFCTGNCKKVIGYEYPDGRKEYIPQEDLISKKEDFIDLLNDYSKKRPSNCLHDSCPECRGTGQKSNGLVMCVHFISCPCPKCSPFSF
jgi:hypothetical protein